MEEFNGCFEDRGCIQRRCCCEGLRCHCDCRDEIKVIGYVDTGDSFRLITNFEGRFINGVHYRLKLVENLPTMTFIEPVVLQLGGITGTILIPLMDCLGNNFMCDSLKGCNGTFRLRFGSNPNHLQCVSRIKRSSFYSVDECVGSVFDAGASETIISQPASIE